MHCFYFALRVRFYCELCFLTDQRVRISRLCSRISFWIPGKLPKASISDPGPSLGSPWPRGATPTIPPTDRTLRPFAPPPRRNPPTGRTPIGGQRALTSRWYPGRTVSASLVRGAMTDRSDRFITGHPRGRHEDLKSRVGIRPNTSRVHSKKSSGMPINRHTESQ